MCDLFSLNYGGTGFNTIKSDNRKGFHFLPGEHPGVFKAVAIVYKCAMLAHGITGPVPMILVEDETKVKSRVSWESKWDTLAGFCGPKQNHICISSYKPVVEFGEAGYNTIVDSFRTDKIGGFARIIVVNPLHEKLPRLMLVVCCTCNCFDSTWIRKQWNVVDDLWMKDCLHVLGPIIGRASDRDSRRQQLMLEDYKRSDGDRFWVN
jgi:hypothetical protein